MRTTDRISADVDATPLEIGPTTRVSEILDRYGDIADVMEVFGIERVGRYDLRRTLAKALTVERAAFLHRVPLDEFIDLLRQAVAKVGERSKPAPEGADV